ncbi:cell division protein YceG involved in septum cleavage [Streptomyces sp. V4I23]|uniref:endolytic transglycosylase MltG n=1 Tax=Streptomyces sp. V4I23 TaxID=3042282 RepID=UPI002781A1DA|nr:endolytic transglycosylase MltG [Streptomyces sp. V4I23]MDQ1012305.1 cell division protein YceG involved in septum cleavage [Streptomyces sp. V4I23]
MTNERSSARRGRGYRLTRRGRLVLLLGTATVAAAAVLVPFLLREEKSERPRPAPVSLVIPEGWRAGQVYAAVDKALKRPPGTTRTAIRSARLKLPPEARGNPEGYLFPATYPIDEKTTPASLLSFMVNTAHQRFGARAVIASARRGGLSPYEAVNVASIVQAEADTASDMGKVARVIHNRRAKGMPLQMDSTLNYALDRSTVDTTTADTRLDSPYNTYDRTGLPPTPIDNPGEEAMRAAVEPPAGDWLYFVTVEPGDTRFTSDYEEHQRNVGEFNARRAEAGDAG